MGKGQAALSALLEQSGVACEMSAISINSELRLWKSLPTDADAELLEVDDRDELEELLLVLVVELRDILLELDDKDELSKVLLLVVELELAPWATQAPAMRLAFVVRMYDGKPLDPSIAPLSTLLG